MEQEATCVPGEIVPDTLILKMAIVAQDIEGGAELDGILIRTSKIDVLREQNPRP